VQKKTKIPGKRGPRSGKGLIWTGRRKKNSQSIKRNHNSGEDAMTLARSVREGGLEKTVPKPHTVGETGIGRGKGEDDQKRNVVFWVGSSHAR